MIVILEFTGGTSSRKITREIHIKFVEKNVDLFKRDSEKYTQ